MNINVDATWHLNCLVQNHNGMGGGIFCPKNAEFIYTNNNMLYMRTGKDDFVYQKELIQIINIKNESMGEYEFTGVLAPRVFAELQNSIPLHLSTQCIVVAEIKNEYDTAFVKSMISTVRYSENNYDTFWITNNEFYLGQKILIMNRRIGGWDGSPERPVIELLGAGGHVPCMWDGKKFSQIGLIQNLQKEFLEELKFKVSESSFIYLGGFHNKISNELVLLYCVNINISDLQDIQNNALNNQKENISGIYLGDFEAVINMYLKDATYFAGGEKAKSTNFPTQNNLMTRIRSIIY